MKKVLILGGTGAIGQGIAEKLQNEDVELFCVGSNDLDLSDREAIDLFFAKFGIDFDIVIHSAGYNKPCLFKDSNFKDIKKSLDINLNGFLYLIKKIVPYWDQKQTGDVVIISSLYGFLGRKGRLPYSISKHGLLAVVKVLAIELADIGVKVNAVSPGYIDTKMTRQNLSDVEIRYIEQSVPLKRLGTPQDIGEVVKFLVSDLNTYITGQNIVVDGGYSIGGFFNYGK
jgi:Dehydrogenases with different specificities (related to short-chain alcohol dehydrogenases)